MGASQVAGWGEVFRCLVRGAQVCLAVWNFRSERAELMMKGGVLHRSRAELRRFSARASGDGITSGSSAGRYNCTVNHK